MPLLVSVLAGSLKQAALMARLAHLFHCVFTSHGFPLLMCLLVVTSAEAYKSCCLMSLYSTLISC